LRDSRRLNERGGVELGVSVRNRGLSEPLLGTAAELRVDLVCNLGSRELMVDDSALEFSCLRKH
jgi:hypothetical protein